MGGVRVEFGSARGPFIVKKRPLFDENAFALVCVCVSIRATEPKRLKSKECRKPQPPLLLKKVLQYTSNLYCNTPPICTAVLSVPLSSLEREILQCSSHLCRNMLPICIAMLSRKSWRLWSPGCFPKSSRVCEQQTFRRSNKRAKTSAKRVFGTRFV